MSICLGIDYGTSSVKALLWDADEASILGIRSEAVPYALNDGRRAEQDPDTVMSKAFLAARRALADTGIRGEDVRGISFSGQMHGLVGVDAQGRALTPIVTWEDARGAEASLASLRDRAPSLLQRSGCGLATGYLAVTAWDLKNGQEDLLRAIDSFLLPGDWVRTGFGVQKTPATDPSNGSSSGLFHTEARAWNWEAISSLGFPESLFPEVLPSTHPVDTVSREAAEATGLKEGTPLFVGGGDQPLSMIGSGIAKQDGSVVLNVGTGSQVATKSLKPADREGLLTFCFPESGYSVLGAGLSGGAALRWLRDLLREGLESLGEQSASDIDYGSLCELAEGVPPGADGVLFLPLLSGARHAPRASGSFEGLRSHHRLRQMVRAVLEGVVWELRWFAMSFPKAQSSPSVLMGAGGGLANPLWAKIAASVFQAPLGRTVCPEQAALGAAILAGVGLGYYGGVEEGASAVPLRGEKARPVWAEQYAGLAPKAMASFSRAFEPGPLPSSSSD